MANRRNKRPAAQSAGLSIATCQFSVEADITHNRDCVLRQMRKAASLGARVVHFSECALSGYAGVEFDSIKSLDWESLKSATEDVMDMVVRPALVQVVPSLKKIADDLAQQVESDSPSKAVHESKGIDTKYNKLLLKLKFYWIRSSLKV